MKNSLSKKLSCLPYLFFGFFKTYYMVDKLCENLWHTVASQFVYLVQMGNKIFYRSKNMLLISSVGIVMCLSTSII